MTLFGCVDFSMYACGCSLPQMRQFCLFTYPPRSKWASSEKINFLPKLTSSVIRSHAHLAKRKRIGWSIGFNTWTIPRTLCKIRLNNVFEIFYCWERRWIDVDGASHTLSSTAAIFSYNIRSWQCFSLDTVQFRHGECSAEGRSASHCLRLFTLWFIDGVASFFHFFHKITPYAYGADGASLLPKFVRNFRTHSTKLLWFSK